MHPASPGLTIVVRSSAHGTLCWPILFFLSGFSSSAIEPFSAARFGLAAPATAGFTAGVSSVAITDISTDSGLFSLLFFSNFRTGSAFTGFSSVSTTGTMITVAGVFSVSATVAASSCSVLVVGCANWINSARSIYSCRHYHTDFADAL